MKYIEQRQVTIAPPELKQSSKELTENSQSNIPSPRDVNKMQQNSLLSSANKSVPELSAYELDKRKYGALLPKTGVYFLPDERIIAFLK